MMMAAIGDPRPSREVLLISAVTGEGLNQLVATIVRTLQKPADPWLREEQP